VLRISGSIAWLLIPEADRGKSPRLSDPLFLYALHFSKHIMNCQIKNHRDVHGLNTTDNRIVYAHDLGGNFTFLNDEGERISGYSCEEACQMNIAQVLPPDVAEQVREQTALSVTKHVGAVYEIDLLTKDGRRVPLEVSTAIVLRHGQPVEIQGIAVPSVIRSSAPDPARPRCLDADFFYD